MYNIYRKLSNFIKRYKKDKRKRKQSMFGIKKEKKNKDLLYYKGQGYFDLFRLLKHCQAECPILSSAVLYNDVDLVYAIIETHFDIKVNTQSTYSPLMLAIKNSNYNMVLYLLCSNAAIHIVNEYGDTPLSLAKEKGNKEIIELLKKTHNKERIEYIKDTTKTLTISEYRSEVKRGVDFLKSIGYKSEDYSSLVPLNEAITHHKKALVNALLESGIDINRCDSEFNQNAYMLASIMREDELLERIKAHGGKPPLPRKYGQMDYEEEDISEDYDISEYDDE